MTNEEFFKVIGQLPGSPEEKMGERYTQMGTNEVKNTNDTVKIITKNKSYKVPKVVFISDKARLNWHIAQKSERELKPFLDYLDKQDKPKPQKSLFKLNRDKIINWILNLFYLS